MKFVKLSIFALSFGLFVTSCANNEEKVEETTEETTEVAPMTEEVAPAADTTVMPGADTTIVVPAQ